MRALKPGHGASGAARIVVDTALMSEADDAAIFLHCLPAHRGEEVSAEVIDGPQSVVVRQSHNRLHAARAVLAFLMGVR